MIKQATRHVLRRLGKYALILIGAFFGLSLITWVVLLVYVDRNEKELIEKVAGIIESRTKGDVAIRALSVSFFRTFPILSLQLEDVVVHDSLYSRHGQELLKAEDIYLRASIGGIISGNEPLGKVVLRNGAINLYTDTTGASNEFVLKSKSGAKENKSFKMPDVELQNIHFKLINILAKKHYEADIQNLHCRAADKKDNVLFRINVRMMVKSMAFNVRTGAYLRNKEVRGKFDLGYIPDSSRLVIDDVRLLLAGHPYHFDGFFNLDKKASDFKLRIVSHDVNYAHASSILRDPLEKKMNEYAISRPIDLTVNISGKTIDKAQPLVQVALSVKNAKVGTPLGSFDDCSFNGTFTNLMEPDKGTTDENSLLHFTDFSGSWENILVRSKSIRISNLIYPFMECDMASDVDLRSLNNLSGSTSLQFLEGKSSVDVVFRGSMVGRDSIASTITGTVGIYNASMKYLPRNFVLRDCEGTLKFVDNDLQVNKFVAYAGKTKLVMNAVARNFLSMLDVNPQRLFLNWDITSPALHLEDFKSFLSKSAGNKETSKKKARFSETTSKIDRLFNEGEMLIKLRTPQMDYKTFTATDVAANVIMGTKEIAFNNVQLKHAGGSITASGALENGIQYNPVRLESKLSNMDIPALFAAFENFGQDAVTHENLNGKLSADIRFQTALDNEAQLVSSANQGEVAFVLEEGELRNFQPLVAISEKAFKKQDFSHVKFADLSNRLEVKGTTFIVNKMDIRSTALNLIVEGIYDFKKGTDMSIVFPISNLTKSQADTDISENGRTKKGVSVRLRARTGDDGKLKISWDPFRRARKNKEAVQDSTDAGPLE